jgi:hypothetical protein
VKPQSPRDRLIALGQQRRDRRTKAEIDIIEKAICATLFVDHPQTVRGLFYQLVSQGVVEKSEAEYKGTVGRLCVRLRRQGRVPYRWLSDNTRWMRKSTTDVGMQAALRRTAECYRRDLWDEQDVYVEVWCEKDALAGVLVDVTDTYDVPLMVSRGFASVTYLYETGQHIAGIGKPAFIYYFGDHDPSGVQIDRHVEHGLREHAPDAEIHFRRVAVTPAQIDQWRLPTRPTKASDSRSRGFRGASVDLDAVPAWRLRALVGECIERHIDQEQLRITKIAEESERAILLKMAARTRGAA